MMAFQKPDIEYWNRKFTAYMHDPLDKAFQIKGHVNRAAQFIEEFGLQMPNEEHWKKADGVAAEFERGQVPSYNADQNKNGAVEFLKFPVVTHPTSSGGKLNISFSDLGDVSAEKISQALLNFMGEEIKDYSENFDESGFAVARFFYTHLALRFKLAKKNVAGLGAFWHRIPADTRFPDHSIWQHNALCSAVCSCMDLAAGEISNVGMMVFSLTPVQTFIAKARKLRDFWTGSVLLSWLSFEGMRWVMENLGPDHILYPSLIDQPLVNEYMAQEWKISKEDFLNPPKDIASFPNKFLFLVPMNRAEIIAEGIKCHIHEAWKKIYGAVYDELLVKMAGHLSSEEEKSCIKEMFERQNSGFWDLKWTASYLVSSDDRAEVESLLPSGVIQNPFEILDSFNEITKDKTYYDKSGRGILYSVTHAMAQSALAASKYRKTITRLPETGEKCHLCGEFEVLHAIKYNDGLSAGDYKQNTSVFWKKFKQAWDGDEDNNLGYNLNANEKLCAVCLVKRMACEVIEKKSDHLLNPVFKGKRSFPSTTNIALSRYFEKEKIPLEKRNEVAQRIHEANDDRTENHDRYYAILLMDGDNMGKLVNGETLASTWETVMHPEIVERLKNPKFEKEYHDNWKKIFGKKRLITPAIHAAISESLGDFSLYGVDAIIKKYKGKLIYAGGDDVCAVLPVETVLFAAKEIQAYYGSEFRFITEDREKFFPEEITESFVPRPGKLSVNLGKGDEISISAGILICHHKENLSGMIAKAQKLLKEKAKKEDGKNACAIEFRKRSGGSRYFIRKWSNPAWTAFLKIGDYIGTQKNAQVSTSVVYRLELFRDGIEAILKHENWEEMLERFIEKLLERSSTGEIKNKAEFSGLIKDIVIEKTDSEKHFKPEGLIVAAFMAKGGDA